MKRTFLVLLLALALPACGFFERLFGGEEEKPAYQTLAGEPVPDEKLRELLPKMDGWQAQAPQSKTSSIGPQKVSQASASYEQTVGEKTQTVSLEILDGNNVSSIYAPFAVMAHSQGDKLDVHKMRIEIDGYPGMEEWKPEAGTVKVLLLVGRRFVVTLNGRNLTPALVRQTIQAIDLKKLAALAEA